MLHWRLGLPRAACVCTCVRLPPRCLSPAAPSGAASMSLCSCVHRRRRLWFPREVFVKQLVLRGRARGGIGWGATKRRKELGMGMQQEGTCWIQVISSQGPELLLRGQQAHSLRSVSLPPAAAHGGSQPCFPVCNARSTHGHKGHDLAEVRGHPACRPCTLNLPASSAPVPILHSLTHKVAFLVPKGRPLPHQCPSLKLPSCGHGTCKRPVFTAP